MEQNPETDKYSKAKIEQPVQQWSEFLQKPGGIFGRELLIRSIWISEKDSKKPKHGAEAIAAGEGPDRKLYRLRCNDALELIKDNAKIVKHIKQVSNATIALYADDVCEKQGHLYLELMGTVDRVKTAEKLIIDSILKIYNSLVFPVILMAPTIHAQQIAMPLYKLGRLIGSNGCNIVKLEMESGVWLSVVNGPPADLDVDRVVIIYGPLNHIVKALSLIRSAISEPGKSSELDKEIEECVKKLQCDLEKEKQPLQVEIDKYAKAKIEGPNLRVPEGLFNPYMDPTSEIDNQKLTRLAENIAQAHRKVYRIREKEFVKAFGENFEEINHIHKVSRSAIRLLADRESSLASQLFIDLIGSIERVKTAERLILDKILQTYNGVDFPIIFMPPTVSYHKKKLPLHKIERLMEDNGSIISVLEIISGAWIEIDRCSSPLERLVQIYGPRAHVAHALMLINATIYEPGDTIDDEDKESEELFNKFGFDENQLGKKLSCDEQRGKKRLFSVIEQDISNQVEEAKRKKDNQKLQVEGATFGSSSSQTEEQKQQQDVQEA